MSVIRYLILFVFSISFLSACGSGNDASISDQAQIPSDDTDSLDIPTGGDEAPGPAELPPIEDPNAIYVENSQELKNAINSISAGDLIVLKTSNYGELSINNKNLSSEAEIRADSGATPLFTKISVSNSSNLKINGMKVRPNSRITAVSISGDNLTFQNGDIAFGDDTSGWSSNDWNSIPGHGIGLSGNDIKIYNNIVKNVNFGISGTATNAHVKGNTVDCFAGDGLRPLGDNGVWEYNLVTNNINVNDNHDDGIQTWSTGPSGPGTGVQNNLIIRRNTIIESTSSNRPFQGPLQGIGFFDGIFKNFLIEDNVVIVSQWHGIAVYGAEDVTIQYNTVIDLKNTDSNVPWIKIDNHKDGRSPVNCVIHNNIATGFKSASQVSENSNQKINFSDYGTYFMNFSQFNLKLKATAPISDTGVRY